tara:strand:+ start:957 stop:1394 length:438 start_codon:yes stop_codon:yes gene_type:complete
LKISLERLQPAHLLEIHNSGAIEGQLGADQVYDNWQLYKNGDAFVGKSGSKIIAAAGVMDMWPGVGEGWAMLTPDAAGLSVVRKFKEMFDLILIANNYHRIQATVRADFVKGIRFAQWLGFESEGLMKKFDQDQNDFIRMAKIGR